MDEDKTVWVPHPTEGFKKGKIVDIGSDAITVEPFDTPGQVRNTSFEASVLWKSLLLPPQWKYLSMKEPSIVDYIFTDHFLSSLASLGCLIRYASVIISLPHCWLKRCHPHSPCMVANLTSCIWNKCGHSKGDHSLLWSYWVLGYIHISLSSLQCGSPLYLENVVFLKFSVTHWIYAAFLDSAFIPL